MFVMYLITVIIFCVVMGLIKLGPVALGSVMFLIILASAVIIGSVYRIWYGYIIFLVYVRGLLVMFSYMCILSLNPKFRVKTEGISIFAELVILPYYFFQSEFKWNFFIVFYDTRLINELELYSYNAGVGNDFGGAWIIILACLLFLTILRVVQITQVFRGPLRLIFVNPTL